MANITVSVTDANNITVQLTPVASQTITIDRGVAGNGISSIVPVTISTLQYLRIYYTNGTQADVGPLTSTAYFGETPITIVGNTISLSTVPINKGGTNAITAAAAIQNLLPSYTGNGSKRLGLNSGATALEWVADGGGTVTSVDVSGGTTGLTTSGGPITGSGTITLAGTLAVANGGTGVTTSTGTGSVVLSTSPSLVTPLLGTPTSGNFSTGTFTWPTFNQNTTGTAAGLSATLVIASGGTNGTATPTAGAVPYGTGTAYAFTAAGTAGQILQSNGASAPTWANLSTLGVSSFSAGTTGFTPSTGTTGAVTLAGTLNAVNGGTGQSSYAVGDLLYASTTTALSKLADVATGNALISGGVNTAPAWGKIALTTHVSGTLPTTNGGTGLTSFTANGIVYASSTSALTTGSALTFDGTGLAIGNASPISGGKLSALADLSAVNGLVIRDSATTYANNDNYILLQNSVGTTAGGLTHPASGSLGIWGNDDIRFFYGAGVAEAMRISSATGGLGAVGIGYTSLTSVGNNGLAVLGNVGIGTSSPGQKLHVNGNIRVEGATSEIFMATGAERTISASGSSASTTLTFKRWNGSAYVDDVVMNGSGNLGIGTSSPAGKLTVDPGNTSGTQIDGLRLPKNFTAQANFVAWQQGANGWRVGIPYGDNTYPLAFYYGASTPTASSPGTQLMTLDASGNLGLGVTPSAWFSGYKALETGSGSLVYPGSATNTQLWNNLYVNAAGNVTYKSTGIGGLYSIGGGGNAHTWYYAASGTAGTTATLTQPMTLDASGGLRVGTTSSLSVADKLTVVGGNFAVQRTSGITTFLGDNTANGYAGTATNHAFALLTNSIERARIDSSGLTVTGSIFPSAFATYTISTNTWVANTFYQVIAPGSLANYTTYWVTARWDHGGGGGPFIMATAFMFSVVNTNGTGTDNIFTPLTSTHTGSGATLSFRSRAGSGASTGLEASASSIVGGTLIVNIYRFV